MIFSNFSRERYSVPLGKSEVKHYGGEKLPVRFFFNNFEGIVVDGCGTGCIRHWHNHIALIWRRQGSEVRSCLLAGNWVIRSLCDFFFKEKYSRNEAVPTWVNQGSSVIFGQLRKTVTCHICKEQKICFWTSSRNRLFTPREQCAFKVMGSILGFAKVCSSQSNVLHPSYF